MVDALRDFIDRGRRAQKAVDAILRTPRRAASVSAMDACRYCGCTEIAACPGGCTWVAERVCSACERIHELAASAFRVGDEVTWSAEGLRARVGNPSASRARDVRRGRVVNLSADIGAAHVKWGAGPTIVVHPVSLLRVVPRTRAATTKKRKKKGARRP